MNKPGIQVIADGVRAYFEVTGVQAYVGRVSRHELYEQPNETARVLFFEPEDTLARGRLTRDHQHTGSASTPVICTWEYPVRCLVWATTGESDDEESEKAVAQNLMMLTLQAIRRAVDPDTGTAVGFASLVFPAPVTEHAEAREHYWGVGYEFDLVVKTPIYDVPIDTVVPLGVVSRNPTS